MFLGKELEFMCYWECKAAKVSFVYKRHACAKKKNTHKLKKSAA